MTEASQTDPLALIGEQLLGRYQLRERIASGGMSVVYRADDERLQRPVCVKVFFGLDRSQPEYTTHYEHFVQEVFALSQLQHPNTLRIYDFGYLEAEPKSPFYVSELMEGGTLLQHVRRHGPMTPHAALEVLTPIVYALAEAHGRGIIHRDIKPSNILFGAHVSGGQRVVKLADFGIAKAHEDSQKLPNRAGETRVTGARISLYSPGWAAPEQMRAQPVGPPSDVFSLGLVLAFAVAGRKVFPDREAFNAYSSRMEGDEFLTRAILELQLPAPISRVCLKACKAEVRERYPTAEAFLDALRHASDEPPTNPLAAAYDPSEQGTLLTEPRRKLDTEALLDVTPRPDRPSPLGRAEPDASPNVPTVRVPTPRPLPAAPVANAERAAPGPAPVLRVERLSPLPAPLVVASRRVRLVETLGPLDVGGGEPMGPRIRLTFLEGDRARLHIKGLSCFVCREGGRPSSAVELTHSGEVELFNPNLQRLETLSCQFGRVAEDGSIRFPLQGGELALPSGSVLYAALLDFGAEREAWLLFQPHP